MKTFKKPDLNAPRFRPKKINILNNDFCQRFFRKNPKFSCYSCQELKTIVNTLNGKLYQTAIDNRDGVELFEQLGNVFIGTCPKKVGENTDYAKSIAYGVKIQNQNWESDQYTAKIFYTNFENRFRFRFHELWGFVGVRNFKREVSRTYPENWKKYMLVDNMMKISRLFRKHKNRDLFNESTNQQLESYNEFDLD